MISKQLHRLIEKQMREQFYKCSQSASAKRKRRREFPCALPISGWNERTMTEADFQEVCEREGIIVLQVPIFIRGFYFRHCGTPTIVISSRLHGIPRLHVAFHELGHHFLHHSKSWMGLPKESAALVSEEQEFEAEAIAAMSLIPLPHLGRASSHIKHSRELLEVRHKIMAKYGV